MEAPTLIRTLYLYLFSLVGLVLITIGAVNFVDMGLKAFVFTEADRQDRVYWEPPLPYIERFDKITDTSSALSQEELRLLRESLAEYKRVREMRSQIDPLTAQRHRESAQNLALLLVGIPLYLYHWRLIRKRAGGGEKGNASSLS